MARLWLVGLGAVMLASPLAALKPLPPHASFDCAKARGADEMAICASPRLTELDWQLDNAYHTINACVGMGARSAMIDSQRAWLAKRARSGANNACLTRLYRQRIKLFAPYAAKANRLLGRQQCPGAATPPLD